MKNYNIKKLIPGYRLKCPQCRGKNFIGVPKYTGQEMTVTYNGKTKIIATGTAPVAQETFPDKFNRNTTYTISYFEWFE